MDRIRVPHQTGRLGRLVVGDRLLWDELILEVVDRRVARENETESIVVLVLEGTLETPITRYELSLTGRSVPRAGLEGKMRLINDVRDGNQIEIGDDDIVLLRNDKSS